jgi:hypothetical protein
MFPGSGEGLVMFPGSGEGLVLFPGNGEGRLIFPGSGEGLVMFPGSGEGLVMFPGSGEGLVMFPGSGEGLVMFPGSGEGLVMFPGSGEGRLIFPGKFDGRERSGRFEGLLKPGKVVEGLVTPGSVVEGRDKLPGSGEGRVFPKEGLEPEPDKPPVEGKEPGKRLVGNDGRWILGVEMFGRVEPAPGIPIEGRELPRFPGRLLGKDGRPPPILPTLGRAPALPKDGRDMLGIDIFGCPIPPACPMLGRAPPAPTRPIEGFAWRGSTNAAAKNRVKTTGIR